MTGRAPRKKGRAERVLTGIAALACLVLSSCLLLIFFPDAPRVGLARLTGVCSQIRDGAEALGSALRQPRGSRAAASPFTPEPSGEEAGVLEKSGAAKPGDPVWEMDFTPSSSHGSIQSLYEEISDPPDKIYSFMLDTAAGPMLYYNQGDSRWADFLYGGQDPMKQYGCGPTAVAMVINSFTDTAMTPVEAARWAAENGCYAPQSGSYHRLIPDSLAAFGLEVKSISSPSVQAAEDELSQGHLLVALMGKGALTDKGHFILIVKDCGGGDVYIADPNSSRNTSLTWDLSQLINELKNSHDSGGPLWSVWPP